MGNDAQLRNHETMQEHKPIRNETTPVSADEIFAFALREAKNVDAHLDKQREDAGKKPLEWGMEKHTLLVLRALRYAFPEIDTEAHLARLGAFKLALQREGLGHNASQYAKYRRKVERGENSAQEPGEILI